MSVFGIPGFVFGWSAGLVVGVGTLSFLSTREGLAQGEIVRLSIALVLAVVVGTKLLYLAEALVLSQDRGLWDMIVSPRMRIPGGILLALAACWPLSRATRVPACRLADDIVVPAAGACLGAVRIGCIIEGCCHGSPTTLLWGMTFPPRSGAYLWQQGMGLIPSDALTTLPTHPLQIYYAALGVGLAVWALWYRTRRGYEGEVTLWFAAAYFGATWLLDHFASDPSPVTRGVCLLAFLAAVASSAVARRDPGMKGAHAGHR